MSIYDAKKKATAAFAIATGAAAVLLLTAVSALAQPKLPALETLVFPRCEAGKAVFRIINTGVFWPRPASLELVAPDGETILYSRRMRFTEGQVATLKLLPRVFNDRPDLRGPVSLFIRWDESQPVRLAKPDAVVDCT